MFKTTTSTTTVAAIYNEVEKKLKKSPDKRLYGLWSLIGHKISVAREEKEDAVRAFSKDRISYELMKTIIFENLNAKSIQIQQILKTPEEFVKNENAKLVLVAKSQFAAAIINNSNTIKVLLLKLPE